MSAAQPETFYAATEDGWSLAVHRFAPRRAGRNHPLLLVHGLAANRLHFDLDERYSLARAARQRGFDTYVVELRGAGLSRAPGGRNRVLFQWGFGDFAERDMPTLISAVLARAGATACHGVGHSMGGMLLYSIAAAAPQELRSLTTIGAPLVGQLGLGPRERRLMFLAGTLTPAASLTPATQRRVPVRRLLGAAGLFVPLSARFNDAILLNPANCEAEVLVRMAREGIDDVPVKLIVEIAQAMDSPRDRGPYGFEARLGGVRAPALTVSGAADRVAPPASVAAAAARLVGPDVRYREMGLRHGDRADYGHVDLLVGRRAPEEVYPLVLDFLEEVD